MSIHQFNGAIDYICKKLSPEIQLLALQAFLFIAQRGKCTQKDVELMLGYSNAAASRNVSIWCKRRYDKQPGFDFVDRIEDYDDRRFMSLSLNAKGRHFYAKLLEEISK